MNAKGLSEAELAKHLDLFGKKLRLRVIDKEVKIGAFRLDAVAYDDYSGHLVVIEFKANASISSLGQLLLYPHAIAKALKDRGIAPPPVRSILITTHLDTCLVEVAKALSSCRQIEAWVCVDSGFGIELVKPEEAGEQAWDQSTRGKRSIDSVLRFLDAGG